MKKTNKTTTRKNVREDKSFTTKGNSSSVKTNTSGELTTKTRTGSDPKLSESKGVFVKVNGEKF
tara:strand:- start:1317 stop:1508 length:192 start_codon:yes stop_codon:yes gene_type:complete